MSSDAASEDGLSSVSLADSTYEIVSNHPDQASDHADESDFTAPDDTRSIDEASTFSEPRSASDHSMLEDSALLVNAIDTPTVLDSQSGLLQQQESVMTSGTIVSVEEGSASSFAFPTFPQTPTHYFSVPLGRYPLRLKRPLRIIYHGPETHRAEILDKIAQAVAISPRSESQKHDAESGFDKFQVVSVPWQDEGESPASSTAESTSRFDVTLIPSSGIEIAVQICSICSDTAMDCRKASCRSTLASGQGCPASGTSEILSEHSKQFGTCNTTCHQGSFCNVHHAAETDRMRLKLVPDLAIYFHSADHSTLAYTSRMGTPVLDIAEDRRFSAADVPYFEPSLGVAAHCTELQPFGADSLARPLDLADFFALNNVSLNHNIALITGLNDGLFGLNLPSLKDLRAMLVDIVMSRSVFGDPSRPNLVAAAIAFLIGLVGLTMMTSGRYTSSVNFVDPKFESTPVAFDTGKVAWADTQKGLVVAATPTPAQPYATESISPIVAWSVANADAKVGKARLSRLMTISDEEYVVSLPLRLAVLKRPPEMMASATQNGHALDVQLVKINATAAHIELIPLLSPEPVEIIIVVGPKSNHSFKTIITCLKRSPNTYSLQTKSFHSLATTLFGSLGEQWFFLALSEAERLYLVTRHWLEVALHGVKDSASNMRETSTRLYQDGKDFVKKRNPLGKDAIEAKLSRSKDANCIRRRLAASGSKTVFGAELYCKSKRLSSELSVAWYEHAGAYFSKLKSPRDRSLATFTAYKARIGAFGDVSIRKARSRAFSISRNFKDKVDEARSRVQIGRQGSRSRRRDRHSRLRRKSS